MSKTRAAIYHFTDGSEQRPKIYQKQLEQLECFANSQGLDVVNIFCDKSLKRSEHPEFDRLLSCTNQFDVLITKDFYHISKNTMRCMSIMKDLRDKGVCIRTMENGIFTFEDTPLNQLLNVATYNCRFGTINELREIIPTQNDIFRLFVNKKTNWTIIDQYVDESEHQNDGEQVHLQELICNKDKYDLLLVHNLNDVHWRTANFCRIREQLQLDIYSLQEGFLKYRRNL